jgi:hypothetical protein
MQSFLACYDYETGGVWLYVKAENASELAARHPALTVFDKAPSWWTPELDSQAKAKSVDPFWSAWLEKLQEDG